MDFTYLERRVSSFDVNIFCDYIDELASQGLYSLGVGTLVRCVSCLAVLDDKSFGVRIFYDHLLMGGENCFFIKLFIPPGVIAGYKGIMNTLPRFLGFGPNTQNSQKIEKFQVFYDAIRRINSGKLSACVVCLEEKIEVIFYPCKHRVCPSCAYLLYLNPRKICHYCRSIITAVKPIYYQSI